MKKLLSGFDEKTQKLLLIFIRILIIFVAIIIVFMIIASCSNKGNNHSRLENVMESAAINYYKNHNNELPELGEVKKITISELVSAGYMKSINSYITDSSCDGYVMVTKNGLEYSYIPNVNCSDYKTKTLANVIQSSIVNENDGVYVTDGGYYYKGNKVNNYIKIAGTIYRIMSLDNNNNVKIIEDKVDKDKIEWDDRFNTDQNKIVGINEYDRSSLQLFLESKYDEMDPAIKKYILYSDWCSGKRMSTDVTLSEVECDNISNGYIATINVYDYATASNDEKCDNVFAGACMNYNYIADYNTTTYWTMTGLADNSIESYSLNSGTLDIQKTSKVYRVIKTFKISGLNIITDGDGSINNPYIIK